MTLYSNINIIFTNKFRKRSQHHDEDRSKIGQTVNYHSSISKDRIGKQKGTKQQATEATLSFIYTSVQIKHKFKVANENDDIKTEVKRAKTPFHYVGQIPKWNK